MSSRHKFRYATFPKNDGRLARIDDDALTAIIMPSDRKKPVIHLSNGGGSLTISFIEEDALLISIHVRDRQKKLLIGTFGMDHRDAPTS
jgi:hypothetical protein